MTSHQFFNIQKPSQRIERRFLCYFLIYLFTVSCTPKVDVDPTSTYEDGEELMGGKLTTFDLSENAFGHSADGLLYEEENDFVVGNSFFRTNWTTAPASASARDGLGPIFNASSCGGCHGKDGRAAPPSSPSEGLNGLLFRIGTANQKPHPIYGDQLQDKSILGVKPEAKVAVSYSEVSGKYADGASYSLRKPKYEFSDWAYGIMESDFTFSPRIGNQLPGLGLLEAISEADILKNADENDIDNDGISGKPNFVKDVVNNKITLGRFGWKANQPSLLQQTAGAFNGDIGVTSSVFQDDHLTAFQKSQISEPNGGVNEIEDKNLLKVVFYLQALAVPARRDFKNPEVLSGKLLFNELNCNSCHQNSCTTGNSHSNHFLRNQKIYPYTDLLLHDMGEDLADGKNDFNANGNEWRTPPLWGIGMLQTVNKHTFLLHDGRARNIEEAILWHGGEANKSKDAFKKLTQKQRSQLISFVESL